MTSFIKDFVIAFQQENIPELTKLCQNNANVTTFNSQINSFFNKAFRNNKENIVKWFMTFKPSLNINLDDTILFSFLDKNNFEIIKLYVELDPTYNITKLIDHTLRCGKIEISEYFLEKDNSILQNNEMMSEIFIKHCNKKNIQMIQYLLEKDNNLIKKNMLVIKRYIDNKIIILEFLKYYPDMIKDYIMEEEDNYRIKRQNAIEQGFSDEEENGEPREMRSNLFISQCRNGNFETAKLIYLCYPEVIKYSWAIIWVCEAGFMDIAKWLFDKRQDYPLYIWEFAFMWSCMHGKLDIVKWIYSVKPEININADCGNNDDAGHENANVNGFTMACTYGKLDVAKWLLEIDPIKTLSGIDEFDTFAYVCKERKYSNDIAGNSYDPILILKWLLEIKPDIDISKNNEMAFYYACMYSNVDTAKWLLQIKPDINISIDNDYIFRNCSSDLEIIKWLLEIKPDIDIEMNNHEAFKNACENHGYEAVKFLVSLNPKKYNVKFTKYGSIESWKITVNYIRANKIEKKASEIEECPICIDKNSQVITNCNHTFCIKCIKKVCETENKCPTCRTKITDMYVIKILTE